MRCKYGKDNMVLNEDECIWRCYHCGYEKFATRRFYNEMLKQAKKYNTKKDFIKEYDSCVSKIISRAWDKINNKI